MVKGRYAVIPLSYTPLASLERTPNKNSFVTKTWNENGCNGNLVARYLLSGSVTRCLALRCVALRCVYRTGQACPLVARNASNESKVDSKEIAIDNS